MPLRDTSSRRPTTVSGEFFPPETDEASGDLFRTVAALLPSFLLVTHGAAARTRDRAPDLGVRIEGDTNLTPLSHLTCVCHMFSGVRSEAQGQSVVWLVVRANGPHRGAERGRLCRPSASERTVSGPRSRTVDATR
ncbi:methylenetetrahydrofolate reductase [Frigoriglobus tundricola]|uniref:Methylenetetrahydrofolate reductase n=1 Tax=Frigoriglobus tundricola TaxID=2774151 RepID=A0A6M5Z553_9BACT|nr:methylenetetrahydrofolate reductase [Frigoriglobus tundricola]QJX00672.1 5,10-methylenetetrahydrofolate reductase [Frigoriglobus tundricola]